MMRVDDAIRLIVLLCVCLAAGLGNHQAIAKFYSPDYIFEEAKRPDPMVTDWLDQLKNGRVEPARLVYLLSLVPNPQGTFIFTRPLITVVDLLERNRFSVWDCSKARLWNRFVYSHKFENRKPFNGFDQAYVLNENLRLYIRTTLELVAQECVRLGARIYKPDDVLPKPKPEDPKKELQFYAIINGQEYMWRLGNVTEKLVADQRSLDKELFNRPSVLEQFFFDEISDNQRAIGERLAESKSMNSILFQPPTTTKKPVRVFVKPTQTEPIEAVVESGEASGSNNVDSKPIEASEDTADLAEP